MRTLLLPPVKCLWDYEQRLAQLFNASDNDQRAPEVKQIALFLANRGATNHLSWPECERFLKVYSGQLHACGTGAKVPSTVQALSHLHTVLLTQRAQGIRTFFVANDQ